MLAAKASRSNACSPIAIATRGASDEVVEMMPKGMLEREKCEPRGMLNHDRSGAMTMGEPMLKLADERFQVGSQCQLTQLHDISALPNNHNALSAARDGILDGRGLAGPRCIMCGKIPASRALLQDQAFRRAVCYHSPPCASGPRAAVCRAHHG